MKYIQPVSTSKELGATDYIEDGVKFIECIAFVVCIACMILIPFAGSYLSHHGPDWTREIARVTYEGDLREKCPANRLNVGAIVGLALLWSFCALAACAAYFMIFGDPYKTCDVANTNKRGSVS